MAKAKRLSLVRQGLGFLVNREELVEFLRQLYRTEGYKGLEEITQHMRDHGQVHDPEWYTCSWCGSEWEREPGQHVDVLVCINCQKRELGQAGHRSVRRIAKEQKINAKAAEQAKKDNGVTDA